MLTTVSLGDLLLTGLTFLIAAVLLCFQPRGLGATRAARAASGVLIALFFLIGVRRTINLVSEGRPGPAAERILDASEVLSIVLSLAFLAAYVVANRAASRAVVQGEARLSGIVDSALDAIVVADAAGRVTVFNRAAEALFGHPAAAVIGRPLTSLIPERFRERHLAAFGPFVAGQAGHQRRIGPEAGLCGLRADGSEVAVEVSLTRTVGPEGPLVAGFLRDVGEQRELAELREHIIGMTAHELRTPLTGVVNGAGQARRKLVALRDRHRALAGDRDGERLRRYLELIDGEAHNLLAVVENMLELSREGGDALTLERRPLDLRALLRAKVERLELYNPGAASRIRLDLPRAAVVAPVDEQRLRQVLLNLVENALKYSTAPDQVVIRLRADNRWAYIEISDRGYGIAEEDRERIFRPFARTHRTRALAPQGLGLGLFIAKTCVERHGGRIDLWSRVGEGTTFTVILPLHEVSAGAAQDERRGGPKPPAPDRSHFELDDLVAAQDEALTVPAVPDLPPAAAPADRAEDEAQRRALPLVDDAVGPPVAAEDPDLRTRLRVVLPRDKGARDEAAGGEPGVGEGAADGPGHRVSS
jgi:PAS domain S-box-containing protein